MIFEQKPLLNKNPFFFFKKKKKTKPWKKKTLEQNPSEKKLSTKEKRPC